MTTQPPDLTDLVDEDCRDAWREGFAFALASQPPSGDALTVNETTLRNAWARLDQVGDPKTPHALWKHLRNAPSSPATPAVEVNVTVNDQNVVAIGNEIRTMAPWLSENEIRRWSDRIAAVVAR